MNNHLPKNNPFIVGLCGGSGSGKTTLAQEWIEDFRFDVLHLSQDRYYRDLSEISIDERRKVNFDHPDALEGDLLVEQLQTLKQGDEIHAPIYDFAQHCRVGYENLTPATIVLLEGTLVFALPSIQPLIDFRIFIDCPADVRLLRRLRRDITDRGRTFKFSASQWERTVKPMHNQFIEPHQASANLIINGEDDIAINSKNVSQAINSLFDVS